MSIQAQNYTKTFDGGKNYALKRVNLKIQQGEFVAVIGLPARQRRSGCNQYLKGLRKPMVSSRDRDERGYEAMFNETES